MRMQNRKTKPPYGQNNAKSKISAANGEGFIFSNRRFGGEKIKISFVIPAHNEEAYIGNCLASVFKYTANKPCKTEVIVVNNASTDGTRRAAGAFAGVKVIDEPRKGLAQARNTGYLASSGDIIANIDADTMLVPGWLDKVIAEFSGDEKLIALSGPMVFYDISGTMLKLGVRAFYWLGYAGYVLNRYVLRTASMLQGGNFVVRRRAMDEIGGYDLEHGFGEDADLSRRLHKVGKVKFTFGLPLYASGRRIAKEGAFTMSLRYGLQYFWTVVFKKPFTQNFPDIRDDNSGRGLEYKPKSKAKELLVAASYAAAIAAVLAAAYWSSRAAYREAANSADAAALKAYGARLDNKFHALYQQTKNSLKTKLNSDEPGQ